MPVFRRYEYFRAFAGGHGQECNDMSKATTTNTIPLYDVFEREMSLFRRNVQILSLVYQKEPIGILRLSRETRFPMHKVRYSLKILEQEGLIEAKTVGASPTPLTKPFLENISELLGKFKSEFDGLEKTIQDELKQKK